MERMRTTHPHGPGATLRATSLAAVTAFASAPALAATSLALPGVFSDFTLREWLLGGVTQSLLKSTPLPLLMSH